MIAPLQKDDTLLADIASPADTRSELRIWWLGQSGFLLRFGGHFALLDPYLSDSLTEKYATTDKPHVRITERVIAPERLTGISVVTSSHTHTDHLDADTLIPLRIANPGMKIIIPEANRAFVAERAAIAPRELTGLDDGTDTSVAGFDFRGIAAAHEALERDSAGHCRFLGYLIRVGPWTLYHSGDTVLYPGLVEKLRAFPIDVAFLPINGRDPARRVAGNLDGAEAAQLAHDIGAACVIPCHYEMFAFNTADPADLFIPTCETLLQPYRIMHAGEGWSLTH